MSDPNSWDDIKEPFGNVEKPDPAMEVAALREVVKELTAKVQLLVEFLDERGLLEEHCFTFPDGDVFKAKDIDLPKKN